MRDQPATYALSHAPDTTLGWIRFWIHVQPRDERRHNLFAVPRQPVTSFLNGRQAVEGSAQAVKSCNLPGLNLIDEQDTIPRQVSIPRDVHPAGICGSRSVSCATIRLATAVVSRKQIQFGRGQAVRDALPRRKARKGFRTISPRRDSCTSADAAGRVFSFAYVEMDCRRVGPRPSCS